MKHFVIVYISAVQSHFWRIWKLVFNVSFVASCTRANIFVIEKLSQKICSCGCGLNDETQQLNLICIILWSLTTDDSQNLLHVVHAVLSARHFLS